MLVASVAHTAFRRSVGVSAGNPTISTRTLPTLRTIFLQETRQHLSQHCPIKLTIYFNKHLSVIAT